MEVKKILVSIICGNRLHWRLIAVRRVDKRWEISHEAYNQFISDLDSGGYRTGRERIHVR